MTPSQRPGEEARGRPGQGGVRLAADTVLRLLLGTRAPSPPGATAEKCRAGPGGQRPPEKPNTPSPCPASLSGQVNNATARVMTNKKTANPYTNGKGPGSRGQGRPRALPSDPCASLAHTAGEIPASPSVRGTHAHGDRLRHSGVPAASWGIPNSQAPRAALG